ncbi:MAG: anhydro-N-acetylmuramic acid kinase [Eudoraea sp.]
MKTYKVLGLMSGTSLDGLDIAYCKIWKKLDRWHFEILKADTIYYDNGLRTQLMNSILLNAVDLLSLNNFYGSWLGLRAKEFILKNKLNIDFIASHGHTTHHRPERGLTYQIGSGQHLANESQEKVICDFRTNDVALGGEGAPLVPIGDQLFFSSYNFCLNLGGIANMSFLQNGKRVAYDIGLANMPLNYLTQKIGLSYDKGGEKAKKGKLNTGLLKELNSLSFYKENFPKSTGYEWFTEKVCPILESHKDSLENQLHTLIKHICEQITIQVKANNSNEKATLLVTGGGALNHYMMNVLQNELGENTELIIPSEQLISYKEALIFALMGVLRHEQEINVLKSVTGARKNSSSGVVYLPA